jgi:hypothetical protein
MLAWAALLGVLHVAVAAAQPVDPADAEAHALFDAGEVAYGQGRYDAALEDFQHAYELSHRPNLLYNIGSSAEHLRQDDLALHAFREYLENVPTADNRASVQARIAVLERALAAPTPTSEPEPAAVAASHETLEPTTRRADAAEQLAAPTTEHSSRPDVAPWAVLGAGAVLSVVGAILVGVGYADIATVSNAHFGVTLGEIQGAHDAAPVMTGVGWASIGVGVVLAAFGLGWGVAVPGSATRTTAWTSPDGAGMLIGGTF